MKKTLILLSSIVLTNSSFADNNTLSIGGSIPFSHYLFAADSKPAKAGGNVIGSPSFAVNGGFGYQINEKFNVGIEGIYYFKQGFDLQNPNTKAKSTILNLSGPVILANAVNLFRLSDQANLYLTAGAGISYYNFSWDGQDEYAQNAMQFAWKIGFGINFKINDGYSIDLGYSFVDLGKITEANGEKIPDDELKVFNSFATHNINLSVRFDI